MYVCPKCNSKDIRTLVLTKNRTVLDVRPFQQKMAKCADCFYYSCFETGTFYNDDYLKLLKKSE